MSGSDQALSHVDEQREQNEAKAQREAQAGPVRSSPDAAPVGEAIEDFHRRGDLSFGIPAHRCATGPAEPIAARWAGRDAFRADIGMNNGVDNRHQSWQVEPTAMTLFADAVGADETLFSTNGSTENVHVAMMAAVRPGETLVMARNGHKSAFSGLVLSGAMPVYVDPEYDNQWQLAHNVDPGRLDTVLRDHPDAVAAMVFTPTYYGVSADVRGLADAAHSHGVPLITNDAWGLDFSFCSRLPPSAIESGADLSIGSVHKSLNGLCQTSVLSRKGERIDPTRLSLVFELTQSTSASSLLLSSIDAARCQFAEHGEELLGHAVDVAAQVRGALSEVAGLDVMGEEILASPGAFALDPTHVCIDVNRLGLTGYQAADWLRERCGVHVELADHRRVMALITYADTDATAHRFIDAMSALADAHCDRGAQPIGDAPPLPELRTETVMLPRDAYLGATEMVQWRKASGRISAEMICPYPPGIPVIAPGEVLTDAIVDYLQQQAAKGVMVEGAADESLAEFRVVAP
ncbi:DegT/DnrJ/EryC1/StrS family aminotransferase [Mycobacterium sp. ITM-2016-00317]|uniref:aminotransferase class I/II-fold pyridoxal phosphate-dependent enzyme n=1 Tax=Mycobacterium sp. ITM-2016-00317 TaxID=2099694 RepID=UPI00287F6FDF|nr:DegT/DnrJ/EryC1/StrS family aminotransferase [Mycobacterium sp. ITM-2016-00317]WNG88064.1 DegT/DnrJ/EryC1/StrS family aminotransferase [Mycobacterium sp. ITM-2016-00317]